VQFSHILYHSKNKTLPLLQ